MRSNCLIASTVLIALLAGRSFAATDRRELENHFRVSDPIHNLYLLPEDDRYALQAVFNSEGSLTDIQVVPKYFFEKYHPEWVEPDSYVVMDTSVYDNILSQIGNIRALGALLAKDRGGIVTNLRPSFDDEYENAVVVRRIFSYSPDEPYRVAWFSVKYFRPVSGKLQAQHVDALDIRYEIKIGGRWYETKKADFEKARVGSRVTVEAVPLGDPVP